MLTEGWAVRHCPPDAPLLYFGCLMRSTPLITCRTQGVVGLPSLSSGSNSLLLMLRVLPQLPNAGGACLLLPLVRAAAPVWPGSRPENAAARQGAYWLVHCKAET